MTNLRSLFDLLRAARKLAAACALTTAIAMVATAQTNTFPSSGNAGIGTTSPAYPLTIVKDFNGPTTIAIFNITDGANAQASAGVSRTMDWSSKYISFGVTAPSYSGAGYGETAYFHSAGLPLKFGSNTNNDILFFTNGITNTRMTITGGGNVGIGTTTPGQRLNVLGNGLFGNITTHTPLYSGYDSQLNQILELGYGTSHSTITPFPAFVLSNNITSTSNSDGIIGQLVFANRSIADGNDKRLGLITSWVDGASNSGTLQFYTNSAGAVAERLRITSAGNVGIGTTSPGRKLEILAPNGEALRVYRNANNAGWGVNMVFAFNNSSSQQRDYAGAHGLIQSSTAGSEQGTLVFTTATAGTLTEKLRINSAGNVGIGTTAANYKLDVQSGQINASGGLCIAGDCKTNWSQVGSQWSTSGSNISYSSGNVGIGTTNPSQKLEVYNASGPTYFKATSGSAGTYLGTDGTNSYIQAVSANQKIFLSKSDGSPLLTADTGTGNVGIGTTGPTKKLHVAGDIQVDGNINAKYQDLAEWVPSSEQLSAGTVVVLDTTKSNQVVSSNAAYDTRVAGVISTQPGITLGESGEGKVLVATTGRVRVKVDASRGPIQIGDLLVTSDVAGVAMKSEPIVIQGRKIHAPGTIIGKALEPMAKGSGVILVLLSLQ